MYSHLENNFERYVAGSKDDIDKREMARYSWAGKYAYGKILDIGCSSGYGSRFLIGDYIGIDYDKDIIEFAKQEFPDKKFLQMDINSMEFLDLLDTKFDTIIAFEVLEHLNEDITSILKDKCKLLLCSVPYMEQYGVWGKHHKQHYLCEADFPSFEHQYMDIDGNLIDRPNDYTGHNLMLMKWSQ